MAKRKSDDERIYRLGGSDPRTGAERLAGMINRAAQPRETRSQRRRYDDDEATRARHKAASAADNKRRGITSSSPKRKRKSS